VLEQRDDRGDRVLDVLECRNDDRRLDRPAVIGGFRHPPHPGDQPGEAISARRGIGLGLELLDDVEIAEHPFGRIGVELVLEKIGQSAAPLVARRFDARWMEGELVVSGRVLRRCLLRCGTRGIGAVGMGCARGRLQNLRRAGKQERARFEQPAAAFDLQADVMRLAFV